MLKKDNVNIYFIFFSLIVCVFGIYTWFNFDHAFIGIDAEIYLNWAKDFPNSVNKVLTNYFLQKTLPSVIINLILRVLKLPPTRDNIIFVSLVMNSIVTIGSIYLLLYKTLKNVDFRPRVFLTFIFTTSVAALSFFFKSPVLNDTLALFFAIGLFYFYKVGKILPMMVCIILGTFCYPIFLQLGAVLLLIPLNININKFEVNTKYIKFIALAIAIAAALIVYWVYNSGIYIELIYPANLSYFAPVLINSIPLSLLAIATYYFIWSKFFISYNFLSVRLYKSLFTFKIIWGFLAMLFCYGVVTGIVFALAKNDEVAIHFLRILILPLILALNFPATFYYNAIMWFGILYVIFIGNIAYNKSPKIPFAYYLLLIIFFQFAIVNESRTLIVFIPLMIELLLDKIVKLSKVKTKLYLLLNVVILLLVFLVYNGKTADFKYGPWMTFNNNIIFFTLGAVVTFSYILIEKRFKDDSNSKALPNS